MKKRFNEDLRQLAHVLVGVIAVLAVQFFGLNTSLLLMTILFLFGLVLANFRLLVGKVKVVEEFLVLMERKTPIPGQGAMFFAAGILLLLTFSRPLEFGLAIIALHSFGDAYATSVGRRFTTKLPWNKRKTVAGLLAFIVSGAVAAQFFIPVQQALIYSLVLALVESLPLRIDDNVSVPVAALVLLLGVGL